MKEEYYAGDPDLKPSECCKVSVTDSCSDLDFAIPDLQRDNIRWAIWSRENKDKRIKYVLYRDRKGLVWRTK